VDAGDPRGAGERGVDGESAGVRKQVGDLEAGAVTLEEPAVLALVEEKSGLLAVDDVDGKSDAVLDHVDVGGDAAVERFAAPAAAALVDVGERPQLDEGRGDGLTKDADGFAVEAQDGDAIVEVDDHAG